MKKIPLRQCVVSKERLPKNELIRVVKDNLGNVSVDITGKANGKGAYIKKDLEVLNNAIKNKTLDRVLEVKITDDIYEELKNIINN
ncbi:MAG: YlxR family protein [Bacilli bacterium]|nr:YlxR family protein [Bacilli bacterium]